MTITVYIKPGCEQCEATCRALRNVDCDYTVVDVTQDVDARDYMLALGHLQVPMVVAGGRHWAGFRPDLVERLGGRRA